jgi:polyisoprenoid-binding protein YceI
MTTTDYELDPTHTYGTSATTKISRKDFGLVWNTVLETGGVAVGDEVKVSLDLQFQRKA